MAVNGSGDESLASTTEFAPCHYSMWDLWWTKWYWDRHFFEFPLSLLFHHGSPYLHLYQLEMNNRPDGGRGSETLSRPINRTMNRYILLTITLPVILYKCETWSLILR
jgi:hypothetical protein